ncbi:Scr1 family TA system antitoxin-like transcriptional regulator [Micromonospora sp. WMMC415]|uniref:Scr1 family TA system antitoxin-like transcriptional regulator n=1 Tax=Micromonospora sp. WMMC415 TaxID=2675222 RepID=UPI0018AFA1E0|nr:Scr1 family TA system antitoxin-like transcriptional regulator [Micromonospora sp. WMMC415]
MIVRLPSISRVGTAIMGRQRPVTACNESNSGWAVAGPPHPHRSPTQIAIEQAGGTLPLSTPLPITGFARLLRNIGGRAAMVEQLNHLLELAKLPNVSIRVLPLAAGALDS